LFSVITTYGTLYGYRDIVD